jgi:hypothetical protein
VSDLNRAREVSTPWSAVTRAALALAGAAGDGVAGARRHRVPPPLPFLFTPGTSSYVLMGTEQGFQETFGSTCHGAGKPH